MTETTRKDDAEMRPSLPKKRPRGRPWPKGVSGNPAGRPKGAKNRFTLAVQEGLRRAEEELSRPQALNRDKPFGCKDGYLIQQGRLFIWDPLLQDYVAVPGQDPAPKPPATFDNKEHYVEMMWRGREIYVQDGWPFAPRTWKRLRL